MWKSLCQWELYDNRWIVGLPYARQLNFELHFVTAYAPKNAGMDEWTTSAVETVEPL